MLEAAANPPGSEDASPDEDARPDASVDRLMAFTDAAVAIALTLLVLPLMDGLFSTGDSQTPTVAKFLADNSDGLWSFGVSFAVIAAFWRGHQKLFQRIESEFPGLFAVDMLWLAVIVLVPVATAASGRLNHDRLQMVLYIGIMVLASVCQTLLAWLVCRSPGSLIDPGDPPVGFIWGGVWRTGLFASALAISLLYPPIGYYSLLVLLVAPSARVAVTRIRAHR